MFRQLTAAALATLALAACEPTPSTPDEPYSTIPTGDYVLFNIGGEVLSVRHTTMNIQPTQMTGRTGCNNFVVPVSGTPPEFVAGEIQTAGQTCRWSNQETKFFNALRQASKISYEDGVLRISGGPDTLTFEYGHLATPAGPIGRNLNPNETAKAGGQ
ncbi:META domain-containing protein [Paracoccus xiamenensis]|uniref:META domain-containing protein n=1 Tax=Paracoccus xiamenensis TaxID=2714901 RepID=UPI001407CA86|nr:META domain-containing protein [Paracoccus xiamenensis]NHF73904.1 META domain-containing protein [Paracoccus xiamenensis]